MKPVKEQVSVVDSVSTHLRTLRDRAGNPTIDAIAGRAHCSTGAVSNALNGKVVPSDQVADAILSALGGDPDDAWHTLLAEARLARRSGTPDASPEPPARRLRLTRTTAIVATVVGVAVAAVAVTALTRQAEPGPPSGPGPWPFAVGQVGPLGLIVRSSGDKAGVQVGSVAEGLTIWVDCVQTTGFDPRPDTGAGPRWYETRWPTDTAGKDFRTSAPDDRYRAWVYAGFAVPEGHDGRVPECSGR